MDIKDGLKRLLEKRAKAGSRRYPVAIIAYYGPDESIAKKIAVGIILRKDGDVEFLERWYSDGNDIRLDGSINRQVAQFIKSHDARSVVMTNNIIGCHHEEGIDHPEGQICPRCSFWSSKGWDTGEVVH